MSGCRYRCVVVSDPCPAIFRRTCTGTPALLVNPVCRRSWRRRQTGWKPVNLRPLLYAQPTAGIMDAAHYIFVSSEATKASTPADDFESTRIEWVPLGDVPKLIAEQQIVNYAAMAALLLLLTDGSETGTARRNQDTRKIVDHVGTRHLPGCNDSS